ncbi:beta-1,4-galactosyltransferase [Halobaculum sp. WSA2]|uniref:Beta-1,4-galactosyltransferase n=1 Tax=Halobaculum saliterrae TaxID=2073113 RepID=A0A6B0SPC6_9EURY|nr:glycosyltransferase [Halobaculum saliterrae]MXR40764.1 beta-1,4-galactosyltransferase [Halobaculum saliterrae]
MIFGTVGTHDQSFNRLLAGLDELADDYDEIVAQVGHSTYRPEHIQWFDFVSESKINEYYQNASVVVGHAGAGTILTALSYRKPLVLMPRRKQYDEHLDNHQLELTEALRDRDDVFVVANVDDLKGAIDKALAHTPTTSESAGELATYLSANIDQMVD